MQAQADLDEAARLRDAARYAEALERAAHARMLRETVLGATHPDVAACLDLEGDLYRKQGDGAHAEPLLQRALTLREAALGPHHPDVAQSLNTLGIAYYAQGLYEKAEPLFQRALAIREAALDPHHPDVARTLNCLAVLYKEQGLYEKARPLFARALAIREATLGPHHPDVAVSLNNLAALYLDEGLYEQAGPLFERALAIREAAFGPHHPEVAQGLNNLAIPYQYQGLYKKAEALLERALAIREAALGPHHPEVAQSLSNLANAYYQEGLYKKAEPLFERALAIREAALGPHHPDVALGLDNLATLYMAYGFYEKAEPRLQRAIAILEAAFGSHHPEIAQSLNNLAILYQEQGMFAKAEALLQRALSIRELSVGSDHPDIAIPLDNLAALYMGQGLYEKAEPLSRRALAINESSRGHNHPEVATSLLNLADIYMAKGLYEESESLAQQALSLFEAILGPNHPSVASALDSLALLNLVRHRPTDALPLFTRALSISERRLRQEALDFSESRLSSFLQRLRQSTLNVYALLRAYPRDARARHLALSAALLLKGRSLEETANISRSLWQGLGARDRATLERLRGLRTQLASLSLAGPGALPPETYQQRLKALSEEGDALEAELARLSAPLRARTTLPPPEEIVERVAASLPKDAALIEFVAYEGQPTDVQALPRDLSPTRTPDAPRYLALMLFPDASSRAVDLGPSEMIDRAALRLRDQLADRTDTFQAPARELYQRVFQPLLPLLGHTRRLLVSPDGQLGLVPFAALHDGHRFLLDTFDFTYLNSGRELLVQSQAVRAPSSSVVVLADPDFSSAATGPLVPHDSRGGPAESSTALARFYATTRDTLSADDWVPLPNTRQEALEIQRLLPQAQLFLGADATKECLLHLPPPGILHLATHGFFLEDTSVRAGTRSVGQFGGLADTRSATPNQEPLLRSGLVLAGASAPAASPAPASGPRLDASLVTALELAGLNLWGTQLVVLSACDTGRGDVRPGQGVYGLRRALVEAGAETVVMSLWKVRDDSTRQLMEAYYRNLLAGQGRSSALSEAMRSLRTSRPHPHDWAPFIAVGSPAPLRALAPGAP